MEIMKTQIGISAGADFEEKSWTFLMPEDFEVRAGQFAIVDKRLYDELISRVPSYHELLNELEK